MATCRYDEVYIRVTGRHADEAELGPLGKLPRRQTMAFSNDAKSHSLMSNQKQWEIELHHAGAA